MAKPDYYELLTVTRTATVEDVKKAYRKKAFEFHPDRNPGNPQAEEQFKLVAEAYEVLSDERQRHLYDTYGHAGLEGGQAGFHGFNNTEDIFSSFSDIFEDFFGMGQGGRSRGGGQRARKGPDTKAELEIDFLEACFGVDKPLELQTAVTCETCAGTGGKKGSTPTKCSYCNGYGQVRHSQGFFTISTTCPQCKGQGTQIKDKCPDCNGQGAQRKKRTLTVKVPPGVSDGIRLLLQGEGEAGQNGGPGGDLYVFLHVRPHAEFQREGDDIVTQLKLTFPEAALGAPMTVTTIEGETTVDVKAGIQSGDTISLKGKGIANLRSGRRGNHVIHIQVVTPTSLTPAQKELLLKLGEDLGVSKKDAKKKKKGFFT
jgi:molecular chaperone DnaJ